MCTNIFVPRVCVYISHYIILVFFFIIFNCTVSSAYRCAFHCIPCVFLAPPNTEPHTGTNRPFPPQKHFTGTGTRLHCISGYVVPGPVYLVPTSGKVLFIRPGTTEVEPIAINFADCLATSIGARL